jgi:phosphoribosylformimino-5-aminoimidazole carboxamide ribonucleotide (ProFAR) isomerase
MVLNFSGLFAKTFAEHLEKILPELATAQAINVEIDGGVRKNQELDALKWKKNGDHSNGNVRKWKPK